MPDHPPPGSPDWPCRTPADANVPHRLVSALYLLLRDRVHPGDMEHIALQAAGDRTYPAFTNEHLEEYARSLASYLLDGVLSAITSKRYNFLLGEGVLTLGELREWITQSGLEVRDTDESDDLELMVADCGVVTRDRYPRVDGDTIVLGPETFVSKDGEVLCWRGANYVPQRPKE